jgi:hypothetical protein
LLEPTDDSLIERDHGRPVLDGEVFTRTSTVAKGLDGGPGGLPAWHGLMVLLGIARRPDLATAAYAARDDNARLKRIEAEAFELGDGSRAASIGTSLHALAADVDAGVLEVGDIPDPVARTDLEVYVKALQAKGLRAVGVEFFVVDRDRIIAGTADRLYQGSDGRRYVGDIKTGNSDLRYLLGPTAIQVAGYRGSVPSKPTGEPIGWPDGVEEDVGVLVALPQGRATCKVIGFDLVKGREGLDLALRARRWRDDAPSLAIR